MARPAYERVGIAFRQAYEAAGLRQSDVAVALDVDPATVSKWSRGLQRIDLDYFPEIDRICGKPLGYVLRRAGYVEDPPAGDLEHALASDDRLDAAGRATMVHLYQVLTLQAALDDAMDRAEDEPGRSPEGDRPDNLRVARYRRFGAKISADADRRRRAVAAGEG